MQTSAPSPTPEPAAEKPEPTRELWAAYRGMFLFFNRALFGGGLREPVLNFSRAAKSNGFFAPERWNRDGDPKAKVHEISINPDTLNERDLKSIASTLVHEMVHLWQRDHGKPARRGHHDKQWAAKMDEVGLVPSHTGLPGGRRTGVHMTHFIQEGGAFAKAWAKMTAAEGGAGLPWRSGMPSFAMTVGLGGGAGQEEGAAGGSVAIPAGEAPKKKDPSKVKYTCAGECKANVWGKVGLRLRCGDCDEAFKEAP